MNRLIACPYCGVSGPRLNPELCGSCGRKGLLELKKYSPPVKRPAVRWQFQAAAAATAPAACAVFVFMTLMVKLVDKSVDTHRELRAVACTDGMRPITHIMDGRIQNRCIMPPLEVIGTNKVRLQLRGWSPVASATGSVCVRDNGDIGRCSGAVSRDGICECE